MPAEVKKQTVTAMRSLAAKVFIKAFIINVAIVGVLSFIVSFEAKNETLTVALILLVMISIFFIPTYKKAFVTWRNSAYLKKHDMECLLTDILSFDCSAMYAFILKGDLRPEDVCNYVYERQTYQAYVYRMAKKANSDDKLVVFVDKNAPGTDKVFAVPTVYAPEAAEWIRNKEFA